MKSDAKFEEKLTCALENDNRNFAKSYQITRKSKIGIFMGFFYPKQKMCEIKSYRGVASHENEE